MKLFFVAGEKSGDLHGGNLIKELQLSNPSLSFSGYGGDQMQSAGMTLLGHYRSMAFMGVLPVLMNLGKIFSRMRECKAAIQSFQPDAVVLIDYGGFNMKLAAWLKEHHFRVYYYISPKVWAWNTGRAKKLKATVDRMFCILPFEKTFYQKFDWAVDYVGNPVLDAVKDYQSKNPHSSHMGSSYVALLPGSRRGELKRIMPLLAEVVKSRPSLNFTVAALSELDQSLYEPLRHFKNVQWVYDDSYQVLTHAQAAVVTSGTATLETGLFKVPQVVVYKASSLEYAIGSWLVSVSFISLVNLIAEKEVIRELLQEQATTHGVLDELDQLVVESNRRKSILQGYDQVWQRLDNGSASRITAQLMLEDLSARR